MSANHRECFEVLRACSLCQQQNSDRLSGKLPMVQQVPACKNCLNWDVLASPESSLGLVCPPASYPLLGDVEDPSWQYYNSSSPYCRIKLFENKQMIRAFRITFESMMGASTLAHNCYCSGYWSDKNVNAFLRVEGLNQTYIDSLLEYATRVKSLRLARANPAEW